MTTSSSLSGDLNSLVENPLVFLKCNAITLSTKNIPEEYRSQHGEKFRPGKAGIKLENLTAKIYELQFVAMKDFKAEKNIEAFVVGYKPNNGNDDVPFVDIPTKSTQELDLERKFLFTVDLSGCSVIVTSLNDNMYRVFHDRRMDCAVLYNNVETCVNFDDYRVGGRYYSRTGLAITCMQFSSGAWKMYLQRHLPETHEWYVSEVQKKSKQKLEQDFGNRRAIIQNWVKADARNLKVDENLIAAAKDGVVPGVEYDEEAIRGWKNLREDVSRKIQAYFDHPENDPNNTLLDTYKRFRENVEHSRDIDETWIWFQVKKNKEAKVQH